MKSVDAASESLVVTRPSDPPILTAELACALVRLIANATTKSDASPRTVDRERHGSVLAS